MPISLDAETETMATQAAKAAGLSLTAYIARLVRQAHGATSSGWEADEVLSVLRSLNVIPGPLNIMTVFSRWLDVHGETEALDRGLEQLKTAGFVTGDGAEYSLTESGYRRIRSR